MKKSFSYIIMTQLLLTSLASQARDIKSIDIAFECSIFAAIASKSSPTKQIKNSWNTTATNWLEETYRRGGKDSDYLNIRTYILNEYEG
ncbi:hypothetical protein, partial [Vibrio harveyi]|uniref:hypothetical protein n=1 Tax=Vibrio harveyi TaxID=669 RepID=UPI001E34F47E